ncbi:MAG: hypothetical protein U1G07_27795 [Verrucomicrobiota bacterium]
MNAIRQRSPLLKPPERDEDLLHVREQTRAQRPRAQISVSRPQSRNQEVTAITVLPGPRRTTNWRAAVTSGAEGVLVRHPRLSMGGGNFRQTARAERTDFVCLGISQVGTEDESDHLAAAQGEVEPAWAVSRCLADLATALLDQVGNMLRPLS